MIITNLPHNTFAFPVGELQVTIEPAGSFDRLNVNLRFEKSDDIVELMLLVDAASRAGYPAGTLTMPYVPFSRQDRVNARGESLSLAVFANLINSLNFQRVIIHDPHSDVSTALLKNCIVVQQWELMTLLIDSKVRGNFWLVSPDAGALKKTYSLAKMFTGTSRFKGVIEASKKRNTATGEITETVVPDWGPIFNYNRAADTYVIVDDICDGGRTFIELAKALRLRSVEKIHLYVTHGFFTKGKQVFDGLIDEVHAVHDYTEKAK